MSIRCTSKQSHTDTVADGVTVLHFPRKSLYNSSWKKKIVAPIIRLLRHKGLYVFGSFSHHTAARKSHLSMQPTTNIYFGLPQQGTALMKQNILLPVHLPFCMSVQRKNTDTVLVVFKNSFEHIKGYKINKKKTDNLFANLQSMLHQWSIKRNTQRKKLN